MANFRRLVFLGYSAVSLLGCGQDPSSTELESIKNSVGADSSGVYDLRGSSDSASYEDLKPFKRMVGDAGIVALGESMHASGGYYRTKARMIRFLVEEEGFRGVMFESPWGDAERTAQYVLTCRDSPEAAMEGLFEVWHSESVRDLLRWLCEFNQKHPKDPVRFAGFDVQQPWHDWQVLRDFLESIKDSSKEKLMGGISACPGVGMMSYEEAMASGLRDKPYPRDQRRRCRNGLRAIHRRLQDIRGDPAQAKADALLETAELSLEGLGVWQDVLHYGRSLLGFHKAFDLRDRAMANTLVKLRKSKLKEARTVVWAANGHIGRGRKKFFGGLIRVKPMGAHLADKLGKKYVPVGLISYETEINWGGKSNPPVHAEPDSIEFILHGVGRPFLLVDLPLAEGKRGFLKPGRKYAVDYVRIVPIRHFQGLVFLDHSAPRRLIE